MLSWVFGGQTQDPGQISLLLGVVYCGARVEWVIRKPSFWLRWAQSPADTGLFLIENIARPGLGGAQLQPLASRLSLTTCMVPRERAPQGAPPWAPQCLWPRVGCAQVWLCPLPPTPNLTPCGRVSSFDPPARPQSQSNVGGKKTSCGDGVRGKLSEAPMTARQNNETQFWRRCGEMHFPGCCW